MSLLRLALLLLVLGVAMLCGEALLAALNPPFHGALHVAVGGHESVVVRPSDGNSGVSIAAESIPFDDPAIGAKAVDASLRYDVRRLPFAIEFSRLRVVVPSSTENFLNVLLPGQPTPTRTPVSVGDSVTLPVGQVTISSIRPWVGLMRHPAGAPMANVAVCGADGRWIENLLLGNGSWIRLGSNLALHMVWSPSDEAARAAIATSETASQTESARWGAVDGGGVNWLDSMAPGSGLALSDGTTVTLMQLDLNHYTGAGTAPAILLQTERQGARNLFWIFANADPPGARFQFDFPAFRDVVFVIYGWRDASCVASLTLRGATPVSAALSEGENWAPTGSPFSLRLDQIYSAGVPVNDEPAALTEAVLMVGDRTIRLRQDETVTIDNRQIGFAPVVYPQQVRCELSARFPSAHEVRTFTLQPGESTQIGDVTLTAPTESIQEGQSTTLLVTFRRSHILAVTSLGPLSMGLITLVQALRSKRV